MKLKMYLRGLGIGVFVTALLMGLATKNMAQQPLSDEEIVARAQELGMVYEDKLLINNDSKAKETATEANENTAVSKEDTTAAKEAATVAKEENVESDVDSETELTESDELIQQKNESLEIVETNNEALEAGKNAASEASLQPVEETEATPTPTKAPTPVPTKAPTPVPTKIPTGESATGQTVENGTLVNVVVASGSGSEAVCSLLKKAGLISDVTDFNTYLCQHGYDRRISAGTHTIPMGAGYEEIAKILCR